ncbi:MAG: DUF1254 domain-containing protein [Anaerolineae bacterium]|nr:DUF1254 domain-containing protein [Anaerolineae bacterium]
MKTKMNMKLTIVFALLLLVLNSCNTAKTSQSGETIDTRIGELSFTHDFINGTPTKETVTKLFDEMDFQRATQAYIWGLGPVSMMEWEKEAREKFGAGNLDLVSYVTYFEKLGILTANATTPYLAAFTNLDETGPLVIEIPAGPTAGLVNDYWHRIVGDMGLTGPDKGAGAKYLIVGPGQSVQADEGYRLLESSTLSIFWGTRILDSDPVKGKALLDAIQVYPYAKRNDPVKTRVITPPEGVRWLGVQPRGLEYWNRLSEFINREPVQERDRLIMAMLKPLGIEKGKPFQPDERQKGILLEAAIVGEAMAKANSFHKRFEGAKYFENSHWEELMMVHPTQRTEHYDQLDERAAYQYEAFSTSMAMISRTPGVGQAYLGGYVDNNGNGLDGSKTYRLRVPASVPAKNFWSLTIYDVSTRCLIDNPQQKADRSSRQEDLVRNEDGSIDLYVGPEAPVGFEKNWVPSVKGKAWYSYFRLYGPTEEHFDKTWELPDFELVK